MVCRDLSDLPSDMMPCATAIQKVAVVKRLEISHSHALETMSLPSLSPYLATDNLTQLVVKSTGIQSLVLCNQRFPCDKRLKNLITLDVRNNRLAWMEADVLPNLRQLWLNGKTDTLKKANSKGAFRNFYRLANGR